MDAAPIIDVSAPVSRVWVEDGCIQCCWCSDLLPEVFRVTKENRCEIPAEACSDDLTDDNRQTRAALLVTRTGAAATFLEFVAAGCPAAVIKLEG